MPFQIIRLPHGSPAFSAAAQKEWRRRHCAFVLTSSCIRQGWYRSSIVGESHMILLCVSLWEMPVLFVKHRWTICVVLAANLNLDLTIMLRSTIKDNWWPCHAPSPFFLKKKISSGVLKNRNKNVTQVFLLDALKFFLTPSPQASNLVAIKNNGDAKQASQKSHAMQNYYSYSSIFACWPGPISIFLLFLWLTTHFRQITTLCK